MAKSLSSLALYIALIAIPLGYVYNAYFPAVQRAITLFGIYRHPDAVRVASPEDLVLIDGTIHCEDLHYYAPAHELYSACEDSHIRFSWFPPLLEFNASVINQARGGLFVINPDTKKAQKLELENFNGPLVTHGIDVIPDPKAGAKKAVYIFAVNHVPNPDFWDGNFVPKVQAGKSSPPKARSQIEIFRHEVGTSTARHLRSVRDPLIRTPNDIAALSPTQFLVTNDFHYRDGLLREIEQLYPGAAWTNTIQVELSDLLTDQADAGVKTTVVVDSIKNNNGLGHGRAESELLIASAVGGSLHIVERSATETSHAYQEVEKILLDSTIDNPSYFRDPYASGSFDGSGFVLAGLGRAIDLSTTHADPQAKEPVLVWYVKKVEGRWEKRLIFEDDGTTLRSSSAAVLVAIDPAEEGDKRRAWLYVTGFLSSHIIAVKVDL
ncbi:putative Serum paraoxonase/arylesterase 2 [Seiridium cardinale]|uniref:Serum paraoxonase/arylesterase 2 n=1 Tax=Seiridium cardinale TaxID=138064 RepID=A0ABR2XLJ3_9PEZI